MNGHTAILRCQICSSAHDIGRAIWRCPCGGLLDVEMPAVFPWESMGQRPPGLWRYREALPLAYDTLPVSLGEPLTPLLGIPTRDCHLFFKLDFLFPTGSFKDRGAAVLVTKIRELGVTSVVEDSSGNAGAAIAAYAAAAGVAARIYVPAGASGAKAAQIAAYGAQLVQVPGTRADTTDAAWQEAQQSYYASHVWNPFFLEGTKTVAFELWEQMGQHAPDWVVTPVGHGTMLLGLYKGFRHLLEAGMTNRMPRIVGVQAAACAPLFAAMSQGSSDLPAIEPQATAAEGIAISRPLRWRQILAAVDATGGSIIAVTEEEVQRTWRTWARQGLLMEPTSATAPAACRQLLDAGWFSANETVVVLITGTGIKAAKLQG